MEINKREKQILKFWKETGAFEKSVENRAKSRKFVFYEGPPTANARPGIHHVLSRSFKDVICRYKTMQGYKVERKAGWDTHGLPVEIEVEKALGLQNKKDIEKYGIAKFNEKCRQSVWKYKAEWEYLTERIGFWLDMENPYITYDPLYMETLWRIMKRAYDKGFLYKGRRVAPYCPRCGTSVSSHEVAQGYEDVVDKSVFVKFKVKSKDPEWTNTSILSWTTTPWTLPGNVALAVNENHKFICVPDPDKKGDWIVLELESFIRLVKQGIFSEAAEKDSDIFSAEELIGIEYEPVFDIKKLQSEKSHKVYAAGFVSTNEGTGVVHTAVMYGEDDYNLGEKIGLPRVHTVDKEGKFNEFVPKWQGVFVKDAEKDIIADLKSRNLLFGEVLPYKHSYPFCWRCKTPLLYYAMDSWFIKMSSLKGKLIKNNDKVNWIPKNIKEGRFGEWLLEIKDWNFSRNRYWGTPLPAWECGKCGSMEFIGSRDDLAAQNFSANKFFLMRHGESEKNNRPNPVISSKWPEKIKYHLTAEGRKQAVKAAAYLKKRGGVDLIFSSDFARTKETAEIIARALGAKLHFDKRLREVDLGIYDGKTEHEFKSSFPDFVARFKKSAPKGETYAKLRKRMFAAISSINKKHKNKRVLIVSHGDPLVILESTLEGLTIPETAEKKHKNYIKVGEVREASLRHFPYGGSGELDFHRPYVDEVRFQCSKCKDESCDSMKRVEELVDVWFDSGSMPFASSGKFPAELSSAKGKLSFPADYICEGIDQTRGWFYTLLAVSTMLGFEAPYKNVISLAHVLDSRGKKMSKSKGNTVDPWEIVAKYGADSLRWYFYTINQPGDYKRFDEMDVQKAHRKFISTLYNTYVFYRTYEIKLPDAYKIKSTEYLDEWIISRLNSVTGEVSKKLDDYDITGAARSIEQFVIEDLSNWYVRRSRRRFQNPKSDREKKDAMATLRYALLEISKLCAPFTPFLSEEIYRGLQSGEKVPVSKSIHWEDYPNYDGRNSDLHLESDMRGARKIVETVHELRAREGIRVRQTLSEVQTNAAIPDGIKEVIREEVNVKRVIYKTKPQAGPLWAVGSSGEFTVSLNTELTPELEREGFMNEFTRRAQELRKAARLKPHQKITLRYSTSRALSDIITKREKEIKSQNNAVSIVGSGKEKETFSAEGEFEWKGEKVWIGIKKNRI